jgi:hypothetical protein
MRFAIVVLMAAGVLIGSAGAPAVAIAASSGYSLGADDHQQTPSGRIEVDIDTDRGGAWYTSPMWIAIGVIALVLLIVLIVMRPEAAARQSSASETAAASQRSEGAYL